MQSKRRMNQRIMRILIDNGHGIDTPGKRSPDGKLREYAYSREIASRIVAALRARGYQAERLVIEDSDISLGERCRRANEVCAKYGSGAVLLVSIHCNAARSDGEWHSAYGWSAYVSNNASSSSKRLAVSLIEAAEREGLTVRRYSRSTAYWTQNLAICRDTRCPAVLTENLFQDNLNDVSFLLSEEGKAVITNLHVEGIINYIKSLI